MSDHFATPAPSGEAYVPPRLSVLGPVHALTLSNLKTFGSTDGFALTVTGQAPQGLMNASG